MTPNHKSEVTHRVPGSQFIYGKNTINIYIKQVLTILADIRQTQSTFRKKKKNDTVRSLLRRMATVWGYFPEL